MKVSLIEDLRVDESILKKYKEEIEGMGHEFNYYLDNAQSPDEMIERAKDAQVLMIGQRPLPAEVINALDKLEYVNVAFTGTDHVDTEALKAKGAVMSNASGYSDIAVSELVIGLIISLYRKILISDEEVRNSGTARIGREIRGKKVGVVGTGNIGLETARLLKAFGADLIGYNRSEKEEFKELGGTYMDLEDLLKEADIVTLHLPVTKETKNIIGEKELGLMKEDSILINCARGGVIDNDALAKALNDGKILGAAIDVFDMEPPIPKDYPLLNAKNTVLTPHIAFLTEESMVRRADIAFDNAISYLKGEVKNQVEI